VTVTDQSSNNSALFSAQSAFSLIASLSVISVTIVIPYTIGYFAFYNLNYMSVFALSDFYIFAATPLIIGVLLFCAYNLQAAFLIGADRPNKMPLLEKLISLASKKVLRHLLLWLLGVAALYLFASVVFSIAAIALMTAAFAPIFTSIAINNVRERNYIFFGVLLVSFFAGMFFLGYIMAATNYIVPQKLEILFSDSESKSSPTKVTGNLAFSGNGAILLFDNQGNQTLVRTDKNVQVLFGPVKNYAALGCVGWRVMEEVRSFVGMRDCIRGLEKWYQ